MPGKCFEKVIEINSEKATCRILEIINKKKLPLKTAFLILQTLFAFLVNPLVQNSNSFLEDLRRLNQLKDGPYQSDLEVNRPKPKQPLNPSKVRKF